MMRIMLIVFIGISMAVPVGFASSAEKAREQFLLGNNTEALRIIEEALDQKVDAPTLYLAGLIYLRLRDFDKARSCFQQIMQDFQDSVYIEGALVKLSDTYFLEGDLDKAKIFYSRVIEKKNEFNRFPHIYLRLAQIAAKQGAWDKKNELIALLKEKFPRVIERKMLADLEKMDDYFTVQVGAFAQKDNAKKFQETLARTYPVFIIKEESSEGVFYKVRVGKYATRDEAEAASQLLAQEGYAVRIYP